MQLRFVLLLCLTGLFGCNRLIECENVLDRRAIFLIDVTDDRLFAEIEADLKNHLPSFMEKTGMAGISACEQFTLSLIPITSGEALDISNASIGISRKGQSYQAERAQSDPAPLVNMLRNKLVDFEELTHDPQVTSGSSIANVLVKALTQVEKGSHTTVIIFSDMIENNQHLNMYRRIPDGTDQAEQLVDPMVLTAFRERQAEGLDVQIVVVCKESTVRTVNATQRNVKQFWNDFFSELGLGNIRFIDNLTNI